MDLYETGFPKEIVDAVDSISKRKGKETYLTYLDRVKSNKLALVVKLADIKHNMSDMSLLPKTKADRLLNKYKERLIFKVKLVY